MLAGVADLGSFLRFPGVFPGVLAGVLGPASPFGSDLTAAAEEEGSEGNGETSSPARTERSRRRRRRVRSAESMLASESWADFGVRGV